MYPLLPELFQRALHTEGGVHSDTQDQDQVLQAGVGAMLEKDGLGAELVASGGGMSAGLLNVSGSGGRVEVGGAE